MPDGYIRIADRLKDIVKSGGEWISSIMLENIIMERPGVRRAAVDPIKDVKWGERPIALVILDPDYIGKVGEDDIRLHVASYVERGVISKIAIPENVTFVLELPLTSVGKVDKRKLRARHWVRGRRSPLLGRRDPGGRGGVRLDLLLAMGPIRLRIAIDEAPPALAVERLPMPFRLRQPVGDGVKGGRMRPEPEMARIRRRCSRPAFAGARGSNARERRRRSGSRSRSSEPGAPNGAAR